MSTPSTQRDHPGIWIRQNVLPSGMTVTDAAKRLGIGRPALSNLLNGRAALSQQMVQRLARTFGADAAALLELQARYDAGTTARERQPVAGTSFAPSVTTIRAAEIENWANRIEARQRLAVLLRKLIHGTGNELPRVDFPGFDSAERRGWDGWVETSAPTAWIPDGDSGWEFGCARNPEKKANQDFDNRRVVPDGEKQQLTFVFVTPRKWAGKGNWESAKKRLGLWKDVRAYDADDLEQWIEQCVPAQVWFAEQLERPVTGFVSLDEYWRRWAEATDPPMPRALFGPTAAEHSGLFREWLENPGGRRFTIAADSRAEAVALVACLMDQIENHELVHRGIVFETSDAVQRLASSTRGAFVAVAATPEAERAFQELPRTLHCVVPVPRNRVTSLQNGPDISLRLLGYKEFVAALAMDLSHDEAVRLGRDSGRSPTVLRRRLSPLPEVSQPEWAGAKTARVLAPLSLAGAWNTASEADRKAISRLAECGHEHTEAYVAEALVYDDPPVWSVGSYRGVVSRLDSFFATVSYWTPGLLDRFFGVAADVLSERDPALGLPEEEQWMAALYDKERVHSDALRNGLREALVILAVHGGRHLDRRLGANVRGRVESVVGSLLRPLDLDRLRSHEADLPDLAEATPEVFLEVIEEDLRSDGPVVGALMRPADSSVLTHGGSRASLLWALERLAWDPEHYRRVVEILARLGEKEIDDNGANTPKSSLTVLFHALLPQTTAPVSDRINALRAIARDWPEVGWSVALATQLHQRIGFLMPSQRPMWRGDASAYLNAVSREEAQDFLRAARSVCLDWPHQDHRTLGDLVDHFAHWGTEERDRVFQLIEGWQATCPTEFERAALWERVRAVRRTLEAEQPVMSSSLATLLDQLAPEDSVAASLWLFKSEWGPVHEVADELDDDDEAEQVVAERRLAALLRIYDEGGASGIETLLDTTRAHQVVGSLLPEVLRTPAEREAFVMQCLSERKTTQRDAKETLLRAFVWKLASAVIDSLWRNVVVCDDPQKQQQFLRCLRYKQAARLLEETTGDICSKYWRDFKPSQYYSAAEKNELIARLLDAGRPHTAFDVVVTNWDDIQSSRLTRLLKAVGGAEVPSEESRRDSRSFFPPFQSLAERSDVPDDEKARLEMMFFEALRHSPSPMPSLARRMAASPDIFVEAIARFFGRADDGEDPPQLQSGSSEERRRLARASLKILEWFERIPGIADDGSLVLEALKAWVGEARSMLRRLGRAEIGDQRIGRLLAKAGPDTSSVWPRREICEVLEDIATKDLGIGLVAGGLAKRGVWTRDPEEGGGQERDRAARYRAWAAWAAPEFPFVARALREIANQYDQQAVRMDTRGELQRRGVE